MNNDVKIVDIDKDSKNGQDKCPKCGTTDISFDIEKSVLKCNFCRHEFAPEKIDGLEEDITKLEGQTITSGLQDIVEDVDNIVTLKCTSCGADVVIDTSEVVQARCHWCRNTLSINEQIPNGSVPDVILPFKISKAEAEKQIRKFVKKRRFFANSKFKKEFTTDNIMGVYFPYVAVDINSHALFVGKGEHQVRIYSSIDDSKQTYYDADLYEIEREFDLIIEGLTIETSSDKLDKKSENKTNNIINSIMPFDIENCVKWNANYLKGYSSEKRDINIADLETKIYEQAKDIARFKANKATKYYDRGVCWSNQEFEIKGKQAKAAYLPVWLYSYQEVKNEKEKVLHYVSVNARTNETMGSVPINKIKLFGISVMLEILSLFIYIGDDFDSDLIWIFLSGILFYFWMSAKYRNSSARHVYETETKARMFNIRKVDKFIEKIKKLTNRRMEYANNLEIYGDDTFDLVSNVKSELKNQIKKI